MKRKTFLCSLGLFVISLMVVFPVLAKADVFIKQKRHTDAYEVMGQTQPAKDEIVVMWMGKDKGRLDMSEDSSWIIRLDKNMMYILDHTKMEYVEVPFNEFGDLISYSISQSEMSEEEKAQAKKFMKGIMSMMKPKVEVKDTGEKQKIKGWNCRKYIMKMKMMGMGSTSEIWATEDIKINYDLYRTLGFAMVAKQPVFQEMFEEMEKIKGIPVLTTSKSSAMGAEVKSTEELVEVKKKSAPSGTYEVPKDYVKAKKD